MMTMITPVTTNPLPCITMIRIHTPSQNYSPYSYQWLKYSTKAFSNKLCTTLQQQISDINTAGFFFFICPLARCIILHIQLRADIILKKINKYENLNQRKLVIMRSRKRDVPLTIFINQIDSRIKRFIVLLSYLFCHIGAEYQVKVFWMLFHKRDQDFFSYIWN